MNMHNGLTLAYLGDAVWELHIRRYLIEKGWTKVNELHSAAICFTSASGEAKAVRFLLDSGWLSEQEQDVFKRGRNAEATHKPKNADLATYHLATGFESLIGHLFLEGLLERLSDLMNESIRIIEKNGE